VMCPACHTGEAVSHVFLGYLPCKVCQNKGVSPPDKGVEFTSDSIKEERKAFPDDITSHHRKGSLNKRWVDVYGEEKARQYGYTENEIKNAKHVYSGDDTYYKE